MTTVSPSTWQEANHRHLMAAIATIQAILLLHSGESVSPTSAQPDDPPSSPAASDRETPPALDYLCHCFGLSAFERDIVLLCAGMELGSTWGDLCAAAAKNHQPYPTFDLAQQILAAPHWSAFLPQSPLRHWQILELGPSHSLLAAPLRLSERILHHLLGFAGLDHRLFDLNSHQIHSASLQALAGIAHHNPEVPQEPLPQLLWQACRVQTRPQLDDLAQRLTPGERWQDLVLPDLQQAQLQEIVAHVRQRAQVYETWGFGQRSNRGLGISALFAGTSGTGKTMAAGVLAQTLQLDLYRIDLSAVVSKYIGETEKNLRRVFDAAESGGVVLLFDEADALFGKRSDVKDSHDRYANMEVSYLLQRMEAYRGLAILTTNMKDAIDPAFMRRIRFVVSFPFPDYAQRLAIWQHIFPAAVPTQALNYKQLAKLNVAGGNIRNIALTAAFLAADEGQPVTMDFLLSAAQREFAKLERALPLAEVKGWGG